MTSYEKAGVNLDAAEALVDEIGWRVTATWSEDVIGGFGGFAAGIRVPAGYTNPVLMMSTDGVGTKAELARVSGLLEGLGYDLVAMVADDLASAGATPIAMTDYIAVGRLDIERVSTLIESIAEAADEAEMALLGGETAEHPGVLDPDRFDLAATALGIVEHGDEIDGSKIVPGDVILGVHSPNLRANGFSLVRALVVDQLGLDEPFPDTDVPTAEVLLQPSVIYAPAVVNALARAEAHGLAHVTGGGLPGNLVRVLPAGARARIDTSTWEVPHVFQVIQRLGNLDRAEMFRTFNMGIGFVVVAGPDDVDRLARGFEIHDHETTIIGEIVAGDRGIELH
ncbi:MAG TPA: phosphoribosylformylglycinamidine cyclo-ligase [Actinobacteria bacterium]|nr:phosphoribosylformylglycinamidine cyclo-ligase [Actinomycetota bacterium]